LTVFSTFSFLLFVSSSISSNSSKLLNIGICLAVVICCKLFTRYYLFGYCLFRFLFLLLIFFYEFSSFIFWVLCGICVKVSLVSFIRLCLVVDSHREYDLVLVLAKLWCRVHCTPIGFLSTPLLLLLPLYLCCSSYLYRLIYILLVMMISDCALISHTVTSYMV
jgi:hypothetical protein